MHHETLFKKWENFPYLNEIFFKVDQYTLYVIDFFCSTSHGQLTTATRLWTMLSLLSPRNHPHRPAPTPQVGHRLLTCISLTSQVGHRVLICYSRKYMNVISRQGGSPHFICKKVPYHSLITVEILFQWGSWLAAQTHMYLLIFPDALIAIILRTHFFTRNSSMLLYST